jgi:hypothetical protein
MLDFVLNYYFLLSLGVFLPFIAMLIRWKPLWANSSTKLFSVYIILDVTAWFLSIFLAINDIHNIIVANIFTVFEFLFVSMFFIEIFNFSNKKPFYIVTLIITMLFALGVFLSKNETYSNYSNLIERFIFIVFSLLFYLKLMRELKIDNLLNYPIFWLNTGVLLYFSSSIFITIFSNYFLNLSDEANKALWLFHSVINLICYVIFAIGFLKCRAKTKY